MKCEKCGFEIKKLSNNCDNCGAPLLNSTETVDEIKSYKKGKHIDIEDIVAEKKPKSFNQTKRNVRNFLIFLFLIIIIAVVYLIGVLLTDLFSQEMFDKYEDIMEHSTLALVYLGNDEYTPNISGNDLGYINVNNIDGGCYFNNSEGKTFFSLDPYSGAYADNLANCINISIQSQTPCIFKNVKE